jgi:hypothetical protein
MPQPQRAFSGARLRIFTLFAACLLSLALLISTLAGESAQGQRSRNARSASSPPVSGRLILMPSASVIDGSYGYQTLSAVVNSPDGSALDVTRRATLTSSNPAVIRIVNGVALPVGDGQAQISASLNGQTARMSITVRNTRTDSALSFENDITPIVIKNGCAGAACHGAQHGQAGFKLSLFGYEPERDRESIWTADRGRRINPSDPANSMLLLKPTGVIPHVGGKRFAKDSLEYRTLLAWIRAGGPLHPRGGAGTAGKSGGAQLASAGSPVKPESRVELEGISVWPEERLITAPNSTHQILVTARFSDGSVRDVTPMARYFSDDEGIASVNGQGVVTALRHGEANIMVRYHGKASVARLMVLTQPRPASYPKIPENNFIDRHIFGKLKKMGIIPAPLSTDAEFIRRVSLDIAGVLPTSRQVRDFVASKDPDKRARLIDELLERPEYQDVMTIQWSELLRVNRIFLQEQGVRQYTAYIRDSFAENRPFDQFVRDLIGSVAYTREQVEKSRDGQTRAEQAIYRKASGHYNGPINYYRVTADPTELTTSTSQVFLGVRLDCARCHNHPFDRWTMKDFYGFAAYFAGTGYTAGKNRDELAVYVDKNGQIVNPRTNQVELPKPLTAAEGTADPEGRRHKLLAEWITSRDNPFFARAVVNRFWKHFFGRGIVHPVDDFRATNPPVNEPLLDALAKDFIAHNYDVKHLIRTICNSRAYQLSDKTNPTNERDTKNFSYFYSKRLGPEELFDAIVTATGVPESFGGAVARRATNLPDNNTPSYFLDVFGRSRRLQVQERSEATSMAQALHLMNGDTINNRIKHPEGRIATLLKSQLSPKEVIEEIFLSTLCRFPDAREIQLSLTYIEQSPTPKEGYEDLMWAILNSREFIFNH